MDDLHERAGSSFVLHLHGELFKVRSTKNENNIQSLLLIYTNEHPKVKQAYELQESLKNQLKKDSELLSLKKRNLSFKSKM